MCVSSLPQAEHSHILSQTYAFGHQVLLFGYGTTEDGLDYWLVKNSWSKLYGMDGFIRIARGERDCGISTDGIVAVVASEHVRPGADRRALESVREW